MSPASTLLLGIKCTAGLCKDVATNGGVSRVYVYHGLLPEQLRCLC